MSGLSHFDRINFGGDLVSLMESIALFYDSGSVIDFKVVEVGYEDCNVILETNQGRYLVKIFSKDRTIEDIERYVLVMENAIKAGVNHPRLLKGDDGIILFSDSGVSLVVMEFIEGKTFFELDRSPDNEEVTQILQQVKLVNNIDYKPTYYFDDWAIPNIKTLLDKVRRYITSDDLLLVERAVATYESIPVSSLPRCFVHGDLTKTNVLKGDDGKIYVLDFSVCNWYPRIQELAVVAANLMYDKINKLSVNDRCQILVRESSRFMDLTDEEKRHLPAYALAGVAMEFLGAHLEKFINGNDSEETDYWMNLGRDGLQSFLVKDLSRKVNA